METSELVRISKRENSEIKKKFLKMEKKSPGSERSESLISSVSPIPDKQSVF